MPAARWLYGCKFVIHFGYLLFGLPGAVLLAGELPGHDPEIRNPYYSVRDWKLWALDSTPVIYRGQNADGKIFERRFGVIVPEMRAYPDINALRNYPEDFVKLTDDPLPGVAGFWDDAWASIDYGHSEPLMDPDLGHGNRVLLGKYVDDQFPRINYGHADSAMLHRLGVVAVSESDISRGHELIRTPEAYNWVEREYFFSNIIFSAPAVWSYWDVLPDRTTDSFDGLSAIYQQSMGRSFSEEQGLFKMIYAGACLPRKTKNLLKANGLYAPTMLMLFRAALPFADEHGVELPYENELRHRPAYYSNGDTGGWAHPNQEKTGNGLEEFSPVNTEFHRYNNLLHFRRMIEMARSMDVAPPVALMNLKAWRALDKDQQTIAENSWSDPRVKGVHKTMLRFWPQRPETMEVEIDLSPSFDLQKRPLRFTVQPLYPEQKNVQVTAVGGSLYKIVVHFDAHLPIGRIPVIVTADNGRWKSAPIFVNFYYPRPGQLVVPNTQYYNPTKQDIDQGIDSDRRPLASVFENLRPILNTIPNSELFETAAGNSVDFDLDARDPEGFPVHFYRWSEEPGTLVGRHFSYTPTKADRGKKVVFHFVATDGTGAGTAIVRTVQIR